MEKYKVVIEPVARKDMHDIFYYISESLKEPRTAKRIYLSIREKILSLDFQPYRYKVVDEEPYSLRGIRTIPVENYLAFFYIDESDKTVHIMRIMYKRRSWKNLL